MKFRDDLFGWDSHILQVFAIKNSSFFMFSVDRHSNVWRNTTIYRRGDIIRDYALNKMAGFIRSLIRHFFESGISYEKPAFPDSGKNSVCSAWFCSVVPLRESVTDLVRRGKFTDSGPVL